MKPGFFIWLALFLLTPLSVGGECFGEPVRNATCGETYLDCESCLIGARLSLSCMGWCPQSGFCSGLDYDFLLILCADEEVAYTEYCPTDPSNPAFENQECIFVSYEWYSCTQSVNSVGSCDANYAMNYCEITDQMSSLQLCNGDSIDVIPPDQVLSLYQIGSFEKNPASAVVGFGQGGKMVGSATCYRFDYGPVSDVYLCPNEDFYVMKYSLALEGQPVAPAPLPTNSPVALPAPLPTNPPIAPPNPLPTNAPVAQPALPVTTFAPTDPPITFSLPTSAPLSNLPQINDQTPAPVNAPVTPPVFVPTSSAYGAGLGCVEKVFILVLAWLVM